jgi:hypothetical protein
VLIEMMKVNAKVSGQRNWAGANRIRINAPLAQSTAKHPLQVVNGRLRSPFCAEFVATSASEVCGSSALQSPDAMPARRSRFTITEMFLDLPKCRVAMTRYRTGKLSVRVVTLSQMGTGWLLPVVSVPA